MRILIDECLDWRLGRALTGHDCVSVQKMGWGGIKNGKLLALAQAEFDVFLIKSRWSCWWPAAPSLIKICR